jgi:RHH-type proline utilization regulon transcriptional repressor/proline dehydrogenase/delta 1-pyrroline-5-carboxylate dehydrogenase
MGRVKWGVRPQSFTHCTELFGPLLGVMCARDLDEAIELANATGYGLTSGLESLDDREQREWQENIRAGNLYINRPTTGAIVLRQPFGGIGKSAVGPGIKAGGPNYVAPLMSFNSRDLTGRRPDDDPVADPTAGYDQWAYDEFHAWHDHFELLGEDNFRRYRPIGRLRIRVSPDDASQDVAARVAAARAAGCATTISVPPDLTGPAAATVEELRNLPAEDAGVFEFVTETDAELAEVIRAGQTDRVRYAAPDRVPLAIRQAAAETLQYVADEPVSAHGRVELLWYFEEQSYTHLYHRYGNLGIRTAEPRTEPL